MSFVTRTPIQLGPAVMLKPPHTATELGSVRLDNHSPWLLTLAIDGSNFSLPAYHARTFNFPTHSGTPVFVDPDNVDGAPPGIDTGYVVATWFASPEVDPDPNAQQTPISVPPSHLAAALAVPLSELGPSIADGLGTYLNDLAVVRWRPFRPLSQAEYNQLVADDALDPNTLYAVSPTRVIIGGAEVWPGPFSNGIISVSDGVSSSTNPTQTIPTTTTGNLLVAIVHRATNALPTAVSDSDSQVWTRAAAWPLTGTAAQNISCWFMPNSAPISEVRFTASPTATAWRIYEIAGMADTDVIDSADAWQVNATAGPKSVSVTAGQRSVAFAAATIFPSASTAPAVYPTVRPTAPPWTNFDQQTLPPSTMPLTSDAAMTLLEGGTTGNAGWDLPNAAWGAAFLYAAFRTVTEPAYVPPNPW